MKNARRKSCLQSGITKNSSSLRRRRTLGGLVGDKVIRPDGLTVTLPELLREAEETLIMEEDGPIMDLSPFPPSSHARRTAVFKTSGPDELSFFKETPPRLDPPIVTGPRDWTKADWKKLDGCYTDERLALGDQLQLPASSLAPAENIEVERVVDRFIELMGGEDVIDKLGSGWTRYASVYIPLNLPLTLQAVIIFSSEPEHSGRSNVPETSPHLLYHHQ